MQSLSLQSNKKKNMEKTRISTKTGCNTPQLQDTFIFVSPSRLVQVKHVFEERLMLTNMQNATYLRGRLPSQLIAFQKTFVFSILQVVEKHTSDNSKYLCWDPITDLVNFMVYMLLIRIVSKTSYKYLVHKTRRVS